MNYLESIKERTGIPSDEAAMKTVRAVLEVLGQRISGGQRDDIMRHLPPELRGSLLQSPQTEVFNAKGFLKRVAYRETVDQGTAALHTNAVLSTLAELIPEKELNDLLGQLPKDLRTLFVWTRKAA